MTGIALRFLPIGKNKDRVNKHTTELIACADVRFLG
jgi:hypothetical protein